MAQGTMGRVRKGGASFLSFPFSSFPALLIISLSPVPALFIPYLSSLKCGRGLFGGERISLMHSHVACYKA